MSPFQYVIVRYVHDLSAGEFVNVGVILWDLDAGRVRYELNPRYGRIASFFPGLDGAAYRSHLGIVEEGLAAVVRGQAQGDLFEQAESFEQLLERTLRDDASCIQRSSVRFGVSLDLDAELRTLFEELVTQYDREVESSRRDERELWTAFESRLAEVGASSLISRRHTLQAPDYDYRFSGSWRNGALNVIEPVSFDLVQPGSIVDKAHSWAGRLLTLSRSNEFLFTALVAPPSTESAAEAYGRACGILRNAPACRRLVEPHELGDLVELIRSEEGHRD